MKSHLPGAIAMLVGTTIGAGVLGIPYVVAKAGILTGLFAILLIGLIVLLIHLYLGEIVLSTKGNHQMTGLAEKYIGKEGKTLMFIGIAVTIYGALLAYMIGIGESLNSILPWSSFGYAFLSIGIVAIIISLGLDAVERSELLLDVIKIGIFAIMLITILVSDKFALNITGFFADKILLPYGVILFAFGGLMVIPEMKNEIRENKKEFKKALIIGTLIPVVVYLLFAVIFTSLNGNITEVVTIGLGEMFGAKMILLANLFAILAMSTAFIALSFVLKDIYVYDYKIKKAGSIALVVLVPMILFLLGARNFIKIIDVAGAIGLGLQAILVLMMFHTIKKQKEREPEFSMKEYKILSIIIALVFIVGAVNAVVMAIH